MGDAVDDDLEGHGPFGREHDAPLVLRWDERGHHAAIRSAIGGTEASSSIVLALTAEANGRNRPVSYSLRRGWYGETPERQRSRLLTYSNVRSSFEDLGAQCLIVNDKAPPGRRGWQSSARATDELRKIVNDITRSRGKPKLIRPRDLIIIRDTNGNPIQKDTDLIRRMHRQVERVNEGLGATDITGPRGSFGCEAFVTRIFNGSTARGGRSYQIGGAAQSLSEADRAKILINGEPAVEIDYKTLHPVLLYSQAGAAPPPDSYAIEPWPRSLVKIGVLILVNAQTHQSALLAIAHHRVMTLIAPPGSIVARAAAQRLMDDIKRFHHPIAAHFHSDAGAGLMRIDSDMAMRVMLDMNSKGIVVIPIHDSFLVAKSKAGILEEAMEEAARREGLTHLRIERKGPKSDAA